MDSMRRNARTLAGPFAALLSAGTLIACRAILGIDDDVALIGTGDDEAGSLADGPTSGGDGAVSTDATSDVPSGFDAAFDAGVTTVDRRFAVWPLPAVKPPLSNYVITADTVTDKTTTLEWERIDPDPATKAYAGGAAYCADLSLGAQTDWRLPTRIEALTFLDYGQTLGLLNQAVFPDGALPSAPHVAWTDSIILLDAKLDDRIQIDMELGLVTIAPNTAISNRIKCVRGGPTTSPVTRYDVVGGAARDVRTGVVWQVAPIPSAKLLADAKTACTSLVVDGTSGWRLPTVRELASLLDESRETVPLLPATFQSGPAARFWSSTPRAKAPAATYAVDFDTANILTISDDPNGVTPLSVRCVR